MIYLTHGTDYIPNTITRRFVIFLLLLGVVGEQDIICIESSLCHSKYALYGYTKAA